MASFSLSYLLCGQTAANRQDWRLTGKTETQWSNGHPLTNKKINKSNLSPSPFHKEEATTSSRETSPQNNLLDTTKTNKMPTLIQDTTSQFFQSTHAATTPALKQQWQRVNYNSDILALPGLRHTRKQFVVPASPHSSSGHIPIQTSQK